MTDGLEDFIVPSTERAQFEALGYAPRAELDAPGAILAPGGWEVPTDGGSMGILSAHRAGLLPNVDKSTFIEESESPNESELFEAYGNEDADASRNRDAIDGHGQELPGDQRTAKECPGSADDVADGGRGPTSK